jgi:hypothetical protein
MKTSELIALTATEMEKVQGGITEAPRQRGRPLLRLLLLLLRAILQPTAPTRAPEL